MAAELPPPPYEEVVASAPLQGRYNRLSRQDSLPQEAKRRLIQEVTNLREQTLGQLAQLRNLASDIDGSYTKLKSNRSNIEREMYEWKVHLTGLIDEIYQMNMLRVSETYDTLEHKLVLNREKVYNTYESARQLCWSMDEQVSMRNHHTAQFMKRRFAEKLTEMETIKRNDMLPDQSISSWRFIKPDITEEQIGELGGKVFQPVVAALSEPPAERSTSSDIDNRPMATPSASGGASDSDIQPSQHPTGGASSQNAASDEVDNIGGRASSEAPEHADEIFTLLRTIQTKTFKDKARCHPISFAVDFDGNVIVPDKFNKKLKIFTQRGQLFRDITHPLLRAPTYVALTLAGDIAVSDAESADVKFFSIDGVLLGNVPNLPNPGSLTFNLMGELLVTDSTQKAVHVVDTHLGSIKSSIQHYTNPSYGKQRYNYFQWPHYVTTGHNDEIFITDRAAGNYQVFTSKGEYIGPVGKYGSGPGEFQDPYGISSYMGHGVIVADYSNNRIQRIDQDGQFREPLLTSEDGLRFPTSALCTTDEKVLVSEYLSGEIKIFSHKLEHLESEEALPPSYTDVVGEQGGGAGVTGPNSAVLGAEARGYAYEDNFRTFGPQVTAGQSLNRTPSWETSI